jgi:hypothetical protein
MPGIAGVQVGSSVQPIVTVGDPVTASQLQAVIPVSDATNVTGKYGSLVLASLQLKNPITGNLDTARATPGATGVQAVSAEGTKATYSSASVGVSLAATATDFWELIGSATKTVRVLRITITGTATAAASADVLLIMRSAADTGGTATQPTIVPNDSNNAAATAVINLYSANPTLGTSVGTIRARKLNLGAAGSAGTIDWRFSNTNDQAIVLRGATQVLALNFNGAAVPAGTSIDIECEWVEDAS